MPQCARVTKERNSPSNMKMTEKKKEEQDCSDMPQQEDCSFHFTNEHFKEAFRAMATMRHSKELCDVTLFVGSTCIYAHKVVLASVSPYFHAMFTSEMKEKRSAEVHLQDVDSHGMKILVEYAYTSQLAVTESNVQVLLPLACLLQVAPVRDACCKFLMKQLHPANCLGIRRFADAHACEELLKQSHEYAIKNYTEVCDSDEFVHLPHNHLLELIENAELNVTDETLVYTSVIKWVRHDLEERQKHLSGLLQHVRLPLLPRDFLLDQVEADTLVTGSSECKDLLIEAMKYQLFPERRSKMDGPRMHTRQPSDFKPMIFSLGGGSLFAIHTECEFYDPSSDQWSIIASMTTRRSRCGVVVSYGKLYAIGGYDGSQDISHAECFNPQEHSWTRIPSMGSKRSCLGVCESNGLIYAAGGYDGTSCLNTFERFDPLTLTWASMPAMNMRRKFLKLAVVGDTIYAVGGYDGTSHLSNIEKYDPQLRKWVTGPNMISRRSNAGVAVLDGSIYVTGGTDGATCLSSVERYNPRRNIWEAAPSMQSRRSTHELVILDRALYAIGGNDGSTSLNSVERFDRRSNRWTLVSSMNMRRSSVGAAVLMMSKSQTRSWESQNMC